MNITSRSIQGLKVFLLVFFFIAKFSGPSLASTITGKLIKVIDGDTVEVLYSGKAERIRLAEIDTPEGGQPYGRAAKQFVLDVAAQKIVQVNVTTKDRYGRSVGEIFLTSGESLNRLLVKEGYAWWYRKYSDDRSYAILEAQARENGKGLWADPNPISPWEWRRGKRWSSTPASRQRVPSGSAFECGEKRYCREMTSCEEALFYLRECGLNRLDGDGDGVPCEAMCR